MFQKLATKGIFNVNVNNWVSLELFQVISRILHKYFIVKYHILSKGHRNPKTLVLAIVLPRAGLSAKQPVSGGRSGISCYN